MVFKQYPLDTHSLEQAWAINFPVGQDEELGLLLMLQLVKL